MAQAAFGTITARTTAGSTTVSGLPFAPRAVIFHAALRTATGIGPSTATCEVMIGWDCTGSSGPSPCCASAWAKDNVAATVQGGASTTNFAIQLGGTGAAYTAESQAKVSAWNSDGFTLAYTTVATQAWLINYLAIGGTDITDAHSGPFLLTSAAGSQSTGVPGFRPDFLMMAHGDSNWGIGFASSANPADQVTAYGINAPGENPSQTGRAWSTGSVQGGWRAFGAAPPRTLEVDYLASLESFDAAGFTLNKSNPPAANRGINYLVLKGGGHAVSTGTVPTSTGVQTVPTVVNPVGVLLFSDLEPDGSTAADLLVSVGSMIGGSGATSLYGAQDNVSATVVEQYAGTDALAADLDFAGPSVPSLASAGTLAANAFGLDWTAVSGNAEHYAYWALGGQAAIPPQQIIRYNRRPRA